MLQHLHIRNYAIIEELKLDLSSGLNIITGETGAGKSILMGALNLVLGDRADSNYLLDREKKCFVEGIFHTDHVLVTDFLKKNELGEDSELVIRREISPNNKSRAFINDTPVSIGLLKQLSSLLVDLHQQFDTLELGDTDFQRQVIDALAGNQKLLQDYQIIFRKLNKVQKEVSELKEMQSGSNKQMDYNKFLLDELLEANLKSGELEEIQTQLKLIDNSENIKTTFSKVYSLLEEGESPIVPQIKSISNSLGMITAFHTDVPALVERLHSVQVELQDIADDVDRLNGSVSYDEKTVTELYERISVGYRLLKKHNVSTTDELITIQQDLDNQLQSVLNLSETIKIKEKELEEIKSHASSLAEKISEKRKDQVNGFQKKVDLILTKVGMPNARLKVEILPAKELTSTGCDNIEFMFDANKSNRFESLRKVASGGELSRLMLSIKSLVAKSVQLPTLIFDEIDTGISGEAARQVGIIMKELSIGHQIVAITHQPQIAARAEAHYFIYKELKKDKILTNIKLLSEGERITTIATMLSGEKPTAAAFENAREMIGG